MLYRAALPQDAGALANVFYRAVREGALGPYSEAQCAAWAPHVPSAEAWTRRLEGLTTVVAEDAGTPVGFMSLNLADRDLDLAFVLPELRGAGVADALYAMVENAARSAGLAQIHSHASHLAKPFFARHGWTLVRDNLVERAGVTIPNWIMTKTLT